MKKNFFIGTCILISITFQQCKPSTSSLLDDKEYQNRKALDSDFIFFKNLEYVFSDSASTHYKDSIDKAYNDSVTKLHKNIATPPCIRLDNGGISIPYNDAESCIERYAQEMPYPASSIVWRDDNTPRKITYLERFGGPDLFKWLRDDLGLSSGTKRLYIDARLGMYTQKYVNDHNLNGCDTGRIAIFLFAVNPLGQDYETSPGVKANVYNLGGLWP
jgi:hypothetical protein